MRWLFDLYAFVILYMCMYSVKKPSGGKKLISTLLGCGTPVKNPVGEKGSYYCICDIYRYIYVVRSLYAVCGVIRCSVLQK